MPIYEYDCRKCGARFEVLVRSRGGPAPACTKCGDPKPVKAFSAFAVAAPDPSPRCESCPGAARRHSTCAGGRCPLS